MKSSYIRGDQTIRKDDFMPTTNISQIISDVIGSVRFFRIEQRRFVEVSTSIGNVEKHQRFL